MTGEHDTWFKVYLAGYDVFRPDVAAHAERLKAACARRRLVGVFPTDGLVPPGLSDEAAATWIYLNNCKHIDNCDVVAVNMGKFRGPGMDGGSSWEMGYGHGRGIPVVGYSGTLAPYAARVAEMTEVRRIDGVLRDADGLAVEDFGLVENLMMDRCATANGTRPIFATLEECLDYVQAHLAPVMALKYKFRGLTASND